MRELPGVPDEVPTASGADAGADEPVRGRDPTDGDLSDCRSGIEPDGSVAEASLATAGKHDRRTTDTDAADPTDTARDSDTVDGDSDSVDADDADSSAGACGFEVAGDPIPGLPSDADVESLLGDASWTHDGDTDLVSITLGPGATDDDVAGVRSGIAQSLGIVADAKGTDADRRRLDLLVSSGHDPTVLADALSAVDQVDGVIVADVGSLYETVLDELPPAADDEDDSAGDDDVAVTQDARAADEQPGIDAGSIFAGLRETHEQVAYEELVDELETVEFGFEPIDGQTPGGVDPEGDSDITDVDAFLENIFEAGLEEDVESALEVADAGDADESGEGEDGTGPAAAAGTEGADDSRTIDGEDGVDSGGESDGDGVTATAGEIDDVATETTGGGPDGDLDLEEPDAPSAAEAGSSNGDVTIGNDGSAPSDAAEAASLGDLESDGAFDLAGTPTDPVERDEHESEGGHQQGTDTDEGATPPGDELDTEAVIRALERAFTDDAVPERTRQAIREALDLEASRSLDVRMQYLQRRVDTLAAYSASWEAFIEENGSGTDFVESVQAEIDTLAGTVEGEDERIDSLADRVDAFDDRLEEYDERFEEYDERFEGYDDRFEGYDEHFERFEDRFESVEERFETMADRFDDVEDRLDAEDDRLDAAKERVDALETTVAELERIEGTVDELETVMAEVDDAMAELSTWRTKVTAALRGDRAARQDTVE